MGGDVFFVLKNRHRIQPSDDTTSEEIQPACRGNVESRIHLVRKNQMQRSREGQIKLTCISYSAF